MCMHNKKHFGSKIPQCVLQKIRCLFFKNTINSYFSYHWANNRGRCTTQLSENNHRTVENIRATVCTRDCEECEVYKHGECVETFTM